MVNQQSWRSHHVSQGLEHYQDHLDNAEEEVGLQILPEIQPEKKKKKNLGKSTLQSEQSCFSSANEYKINYLRVSFYLSMLILHISPYTI